MDFRYTAIAKDGRTVRSTASAASKEILIGNLNKQGLHPIIVKREIPKSNPLSKYKLVKKVPLKELVVFTRQLSTMVSAGVPLSRSLATLQDQSENKYFHQVIAGVSKDVESGLPLAEGFAKYPNVFSDVYVSMVRAGEAGGILDEILKRLASQVEQDASIRKKIKSAMTYPAVILTITVFAFFGIMFFIIPKIGKILTDLGGSNAQLPIYTRALLSISDFSRHYALIIIPFFIIVIVLVRRYVKTEKGKYQFHAVLLKTPIIKTVVLKIAIARFARTFASLMSAGVSVLDSLAVTGGAMGNKVIEAELKEAAKEVKNGKPLSDPLSKSKYFPPIVSQMLSVGEETGQIDTILIKVADFYEEEVNAMIDGLSALIEPMMIIILGTIVGIIAASVMGPISNLSKNIGSN